METRTHNDRFHRHEYMLLTSSEVELMETQTHKGKAQAINCSSDFLGS